MKFLTGEYYVEVKDHRYKIRSTENNILGLRHPPQTLRTQYQVQKETQSQKTFENIENETAVKNYPKKKQPIQHQQLKFKPANCPTCNRNKWLEFE